MQKIINIVLIPVAYLYMFGLIWWAKETRAGREWVERNFGD